MTETDSDVIGKKRSRETPTRRAAKGAYVECPVCGKSFFSFEIETHVVQCLPAEPDDDELRSPPPKRKSPKTSPNTAPTDVTKITEPKTIAHVFPPKKEKVASKTVESKPNTKPTPSIRTSQQGTTQTGAPRARATRDPLFDTIPDAPVFHPTVEEFLDPMKYIYSIRPLAEPFGICKIVPPGAQGDWLGGHTFEKTVQPDMYCFQTKRQNVWELYKRGFASLFVDELNSFRKLKGDSPISAHPSIQNKILQPYQLYRTVLAKGGYRTVEGEESTGNKWEEVAQELGFPVNAATELRDYYWKNIYHFELRKKAEKEYGIPGIEYPESISPTESAPEFGFEEGKSYTMSGFKKMANRFHRQFFNFRPGDKGELSPAEIENEFWNIVEQRNGVEPVTVVYGSDLDARIHGSGFSDKTESLWNLNRFPVAEGSLLRNLPEPISGVTIPMVYVGMMFSCFCWHVEDDYLGSINYLHTGAPKLWYGVGSDNAPHFEAVMKEYLPDLFDSQPDLLHHLITMLSPAELVKNNVPLVRAIQMPGEFVITFPRAYHAGLNTGFNCAEAVNFATADWVRYGGLSQANYRAVRRSHVVSYEEVVWDSLQSERDPTVLTWLVEELREICRREKSARDRLLSLGLSRCLRWKDPSPPSFPLSQPCKICSTECFLSAVACTVHSDVLTCAAHLEEGCACGVQEKYLLMRQPLAQVQHLIHLVEAELARAWGYSDPSLVFAAAEGQPQALPAPYAASIAV